MRALLFRHGVGVIDIFMIGQVTAGLLFMVFFPPSGIAWRDFNELAR